MKRVPEGFTTEVGELLFSLQAVLIEEGEAGEGLVAPPLLPPSAPLDEPPRVMDVAPADPKNSPPVEQIAIVREPTPDRFLPAPPGPALFDPSTGAPTGHQLRREMDLHGSRVSASLVALDVTPIADIRAEQGDAVADGILRVIVEAVPFAFRATDQVFRTGLDELTLCVPGTDLSNAAVMSLRLQMAVKDVLLRRELPAVILSVRPYQQAAA
jgi:hypothetical protein